MAMGGDGQQNQSGSNQSGQQQSQNQNQDQNQNAESGQQQQQGGDNNQNNDDNFNDLWDNPSDNQDGNNQQSQQSGQQQQQQQDADPNKTFDTYIASLNLSEGIDVAAISGELNNGQTEGLNNAFSTVARNVYRQAMIDVNKIIDKKVESGVSKAIQQSTNAVQGNMAVDRMQASLSFTKDPAINPIATAVLSQLIKKGKSVDDAILGVRNFFTKTANISAKELGINQPPRGRPGNQQFNNNVDNDDDGEMDWLETLNV